MRYAVRFAISAATILTVLLFLLEQHLEDIWDQYNVPAFIHFSLRNSFHNSTLDYTFPSLSQAGDKVIVMAKMEHEDTDWVEENLPEYASHSLIFNFSIVLTIPSSNSWQHAIYTVNPSNRTSPYALTTPLNKGHESMAYLTYIIDNYHSLPLTLTFLHSHRSGFFTAWHTDTPLHDNVYALRALQTTFVQQNGYVNLRCNWNPGCKIIHRKNKHVTREVWQEVFANTSTSPANMSSHDPSPPFNYPGYSSTSSAADNEAALKAQYIPTEVGTACCAQFAVSRDRVLQRPLSDYKRFRRWIIETDESDAKSGRVMEYLWHVIFGMEAV
ncbi:hypothetical protein MMC12_004697 [Toensbergia leucococca]|nr:hypothetical protein [Toensbergia leucococca]